MSAMRLRRSALLALGLLATAACGDVSSAEAPGAALYTVPGHLSSGAFDVPEGTYRSVLNWLSFGGGEFIECLETAERSQCIHLAGRYEATIAIEPARLVPRFPSQFSLQVVSLPDPDLTLSHKGAVLAFGSVSIYDDRDDDGVLDLSDDVGPQEADRLVATSVMQGVPSVIIYREGPLHPAWKTLRAFGCADPPVGFSVVVDPTGLGCTVKPVADLTVSPITATASARMLCVRAERLSRTTVAPRWDFALNPNAVVTCDPSGASLRYYIDSGQVCDRFFERTLELRGCLPGVTSGEGCWDRTDNPPSWWPCPLR